jgi:hypothetical protein
MTQRGMARVRLVLAMQLAPFLPNYSHTFGSVAGVWRVEIENYWRNADYEF